MVVLIRGLAIRPKFLISGSYNNKKIGGLKSSVTHVIYIRLTSDDGNFMLQTETVSPRLNLARFVSSVSVRKQKVGHCEIC